MINDVLEEHFVTATKIRATNVTKCTFLFVIGQEFSLNKNLTTSIIVMRAINRQICQNLLQGRIWTFSNYRSTFTYRFTLFTQLMRLIQTTVTVLLLFSKSWYCFTLRTLQTCNGVFQKWFIFDIEFGCHFSRFIECFFSLKQQEKTHVLRFNRFIILKLYRLKIIGLLLIQKIRNI